MANDSLMSKHLKILRALRDGRVHCEDTMPRASLDFLQEMYFTDLIDGAGGRRDSRGYGNFKYSRFWKITEKGLKVLAGLSDA